MYKKISFVFILFLSISVYSNSAYSKNLFESDLFYEEEAEEDIFQEDIFDLTDDFEKNIITDQLVSDIKNELMKNKDIADSNDILLDEDLIDEQMGFRNIIEEGMSDDELAEDDNFLDSDDMLSREDSMDDQIDFADSNEESISDAELAEDDNFLDNNKMLSKEDPMDKQMGFADSNEEKISEVELAEDANFLDSDKMLSKEDPMDSKMDANSLEDKVSNDEFAEDDILSNELSIEDDIDIDPFAEGEMDDQNQIKKNFNEKMITRDENGNAIEKVIHSMDNSEDSSKEQSIREIKFGSLEYYLLEFIKEELPEKALELSLDKKAKVLKNIKQSNKIEPIDIENNIAKKEVDNNASEISFLDKTSKKGEKPVPHVKELDAQKSLKVSDLSVKEDNKEEFKNNLVSFTSDEKEIQEEGLGAANIVDYGFEKIKESPKEVILKYTDAIKKDKEININYLSSKFSQGDKNSPVHLAKESEKNNFGEIIKAAYKSLIAGQTEMSLTLYKRALKLKPNDITAMTGLATAYQKSGEISKSIEIYNKVLKLSPNNMSVINNLLSLFADTDPKYVITKLKVLEKKNPIYTPVIAQLAAVYTKQGDLKKAAEYLKRAIALAPVNLSYQYNLAIVSDQLGRKREAIYLYKRILENRHVLRNKDIDIKEIYLRLGFLESSK